MYAAPDGFKEQFALIEEYKQAEYAEYADEADASQHEHVVCAGEEECKIGGQYGQ